MTTLLNLPMVKAFITKANGFDRARYNKMYFAKNRDAIKAKIKSRKEQIAAQKKEYYIAHKDEINQRNNEWYKLNRIKILKRLDAKRYGIK